MPPPGHSKDPPFPLPMDLPRSLPCTLLANAGSSMYQGAEHESVSRRHTKLHIRAVTRTKVGVAHKILALLAITYSNTTYMCAFSVRLNTQRIAGQHWLNSSACLATCFNFTQWVLI